MASDRFHRRTPSLESSKLAALRPGAASPALSFQASDGASCRVVPVGSDGVIAAPWTAVHISPAVATIATQRTKRRSRASSRSYSANPARTPHARTGTIAHVAAIRCDWIAPGLVKVRSEATSAAESPVTYAGTTNTPAIARASSAHRSSSGRWVAQPKAPTRVALIDSTIGKECAIRCRCSQVTGSPRSSRARSRPHRG